MFCHTMLYYIILYYTIPFYIIICYVKSNYTMNIYYTIYYLYCIYMYIYVYKCIHNQQTWVCWSPTFIAAQSPALKCRPDVSGPLGEGPRLKAKPPRRATR